MSRLCVKNLPKNITNDKLKEIFSSKGELTDVKIAKTSSGKSRQFCFIGYRNEEDAKVAKHFFNNTFIGTSKITVDFARKIGDTSLLTEAKSKYTKTKLAKNEEKQLKKQQENEKKLLQEKEKKQKQKDEQKQLHDRKKQEFLAVMKSRQVSNKWGNDEVIEENIEMNHNNIQDESLESDDDDDDDGGGGGSDSDGEGSDDDNNACNEDEPITQKTPTSSSDLDFLRSKINKKLRDDDSIEEDHTKAVGTNDKHSKKRKRLRSLNTSNENEQINDDIISNEADEAKVDEDDLQMSDFSRLFIRNLPFTCTEDDLRSSFEHYGNLTEVHIPLDLQKRSKGIGFVEFMFPESAKKALSELDGTSFQGRLLHIVPAKEKANAEMPGDSKGVSAPGNNYNGLSSYKSKKEEMRRSMAGLKDNWNSSYVRSDAVVSSIAEKYGLREDEVLDTNVSGGELAVRLAIGESNVIRENHEYFLNHGVDIEALEAFSSERKASHRSTTTILLKNLPHDCVENELESMFTRFGTIASFLVPPSRSMALVDFIEPSEARAAFKGLAYRNYKHVPLYLEWAPLGIIKKTNNTAKAEEKNEKQPQAAEVLGLDDNLDDFSTLYVKNLNFDTTEDDLRNHILKMGLQGMRTVSITKRPKGNEMKSIGYGFIEFQSIDMANLALKRLHGSVLDGHTLESKPSEKRLTQQPSGKTASTSKEKNSSKLIVRNVAFQASKTEIMGLFAAFGNVKRVRIPKKMNGTHRGFAFVDFSSSQEALNAMNSLKNAHFFGRHLVLEWAKDEIEDGVTAMTELRKKANKDYRIQNEMKKRRKTEEFDEYGMKSTEEGDSFDYDMDGEEEDDES